MKIWEFYSPHHFCSKIYVKSTHLVQTYTVHCFHEIFFKWSESKFLVFPHCVSASAVGWWFYRHQRGSTTTLQCGALRSVLGSKHIAFFSLVFFFFQALWNLVEQCTVTKCQEITYIVRSEFGFDEWVCKEEFWKLNNALNLKSDFQKSNMDNSKSVI